MKLIKEIKLKPGFSENDILREVEKITKINRKDVLGYEIVKEGIDARHKPNVFYVLNVAINVADGELKKLDGFEDIIPDHSGFNVEVCDAKEQRPVVVGFGPSGMFAGLILARAGLKPIILEQGKCVEERQKDVDKLWNERVLNVHSNVQYGEGGAGTFSDGKLNTTLNNEYCKKIINEFIYFGAPKSIYYKNKPHIGTDNLKIIVKNIRNEIIKLGGNIVFNAFFNNFSIKNRQIQSIFYKNLENGDMKEIKTNNVVLALGHSPFETFEMLVKKGVEFRKKPFAMGVRIEHLQETINIGQYGDGYDRRLPPADYKLVKHLNNGRSVFTFCMCPGGKVVASSSESGTIVTNGMSNYDRAGKFANSALLVNVNPDDFSGDDILAGFCLQKEIEKRAFILGGSNYNAPAMTVGQFLDNQPKSLKDTYENMNKYSYIPDLCFCDFTPCFPSFINDSLKEAIPLFGKSIKGFDSNDAVLIAPETRSSCPVQAVRADNYVCTFDGLYMCGEGAGYAGGIMSSAIDGVKCAFELLEKM